MRTQTLPTSVSSSAKLQPQRSQTTLKHSTNVNNQNSINKTRNSKEPNETPTQPQPQTQTQTHPQIQTKSLSPTDAVFVPYSSIKQGKHIEKRMVGDVFEAQILGKTGVFACKMIKSKTEDTAVSLSENNERKSLKTHEFQIMKVTKYISWGVRNVK
jgi:hypothetical protein